MHFYARETFWIKEILLFFFFVYEKWREKKIKRKWVIILNIRNRKVTLILNVTASKPFSYKISYTFMCIHRVVTFNVTYNNQYVVDVSFSFFIFHNVGYLLVISSVLFFFFFKVLFYVQHSQMKNSSNKFFNKAFCST